MAERSEKLMAEWSTLGDDLKSTVSQYLDDPEAHIRARARKIMKSPECVLIDLPIWIKTDQAHTRYTENGWSQL